MSRSYPLFVKRDLDGFFGLFIDNVVQLLLIVNLCALCGMDGPGGSRFITQHILPGAAISILFGNIFYAWQAHRVARRLGRSDITALPYGINTPSLLIYIFFVMLPVYLETKSPEAAWKMGLVACIGSGIIELVGSFIAEKLRRSTPRAALLSTLAGIAIGFISMSFVFQIYVHPIEAMLPLAIILITYFARVSFPLGLPGGFVAVLLGTLAAWILPAILPESLAGKGMSVSAVSTAWEQRSFTLPQWAGAELWEVLQQPVLWWKYLSVIIPMGLFNIIGSLQNIESAEAAGDRFDTRSSLAVNGVGTILASLFGSCFPTTIYIGHPGWKQLGARAGYSTLNGLVITAIGLTGTVGLINSLVPIQAGVAIVLWIGIIITAQAFQAVAPNHAPAVAIGLFPAIAAWGLNVMMGAFFLAGGKTLQDILTANPLMEANGFLIQGMLIVDRGYILTCMFLSAICAFLIERQFNRAAGWAAAAAIAALIGLTHSFQVLGNNVDYLFMGSKPIPGAWYYHAYPIAIGYSLCALTFSLVGKYDSLVSRQRQA